MAKMGRPAGVPKVQFNSLIEVNTLKRFRKGCERKGVTISSVIEKMIASWLKSQEVGKKNGLSNKGKSYTRRNQHSPEPMLTSLETVLGDPYSLPVQTEELIRLDMAVR